MAISDVFTALTEHRPYRKGITPDKALHFIQQMADHRALDSHVVSVLKTHLDEINSARISSQSEAGKENEEQSV